jgi:lipoate-protein ligase A
MVVRAYDLQDAELLTDNSSKYRCMVWEPAFLAVVLGQSNSIEDSVHIEAVKEDGVPVYKRPSGGESVVLSSKTLVISILKRGEQFRSPRLYFQSYNETVVAVLASLGVGGLGMDGISDICIGNKKILGSSIYRNKDLVLYHAVLNLSESVDVIERYLKHPKREPEYRSGRSHKHFVTSLTEQGYNLNPNDIITSLNKSFFGGPGPPPPRRRQQ